MISQADRYRFAVTAMAYTSELDRVAHASLQHQSRHDKPDILYNYIKYTSLRGYGVQVQMDYLISQDVALAFKL